MPRTALALVVLTLAAAPAVACPPELDVRGLGGAWQRSVAALRAELASRDDVDRCVELEVFAGAGGVEVTAWFPDGRHATRSIDSLQALRATVLALVLVPASSGEVAPMVWVVQPPIAIPAPSEPTIAAAVAPVVPVWPVWPLRRVLSATVAMGEHWATNERGASAIAGVHVGRAAWSVGASLDFARAHDAAGFTESTFELGAELGYRLAAAVPLTFSVGPRVAWLGQQLDVTPAFGTIGSIGAVMKASDGTRSATMLRAGGGIRAELAATSVFALALAARGAFDVTSDIANRGPGYATPALPEWSFELALEGEVRLWP